MLISSVRIIKCTLNRIEFNNSNLKFRIKQPFIKNLLIEIKYEEK